jgi:hypothetical protein
VAVHRAQPGRCRATAGKEPDGPEVVGSH